MKKSDEVAKIIDRLGGSGTISLQLQLDKATVAQWKIRGSIPVIYWQKICRFARAIGKKMDYETLASAHIIDYKRQQKAEQE